MSTESFGPHGEVDLPSPERFLIIPLIVRLQKQPMNPDGKPLSPITPDHVIDFYQGLEQFRGEFSSALHAS